MSKKAKDYRKVKAMKGTIFARSLKDDPVAHQRRCGLFYQHGVNPAAVARGAEVESIGDGKVRVYYSAVYLPPEQDEWPGSHRGAIVVPPGIQCEHGGFHKRHTVKQIRSFEATQVEVLA